MASAIICDKCGMTCTDVSKFKYIRVHKLVDTNKFNTNAENNMELCIDCYNKIFNEEVNNND